MFKYKSNSRENQDLIILALMDKKRNGTYVEIGGSYPITDNTSYLLEKEFNWQGISIEIMPHNAVQWFGVRKNPCLCLDATKIDYDQLFESHKLPKNIDFLQIDIEPAENTFRALQKINFNKYNFTFLTFEHDLHGGGVKERQMSREILFSHGYTMLIADVMHDNKRFEDWFVYEPNLLNDNWKLFVGSEVNMNSQKMEQKYIDLLQRLL